MATKQAIAAVIITLCLASAAIAGDAPKSSAQSRPGWCKVGWKCQPETECSPARGWRCISTKELIEDSDYHYDLQEQVLQSKRRAVRFAAPFILAGSLRDAGDGDWSPFIFGGVRIWKIGLQGGVYSRGGEARIGTEVTFYHEW